MKEFYGLTMTLTIPNTKIFIDAADILHTIEYSEIKRGLHITIDESLAL